MTNVMIPNFVEFIEADSVVKIRWEHKEAKLVDSNDREISLLEVLPVLKDKCTRKKLFGKQLLSNGVKYCNGLQFYSAIKSVLSLIEDLLQNKKIAFFATIHSMHNVHIL